MIHFLNERIVLPVSDMLQGLSISEKLTFLMKSQYWTKAELIHYQEERLYELIRHINEHVPFYKEWFKKNKLRPEDIRNSTDLGKIPILSKAEIRKSPNLFKSKKFITKNSIRMNSSGSTGEPFEYFLSKEAFSMKYAAAIRSWYWMGYRLGDFYVKLSQNKRSSTLKKIQDIINRSLYLYIPDLSYSTLKNVIQKLEKEKPVFVRCYPDPLYFIAKILKSENKYLHDIKAINTTGNILTVEARNLIEERFTCPVFDSYGVEGSAIFSQSSTRDSYLGSMEYSITEVVDSEGKEVNAGEIGLHVTTDLWNYSMPLIRYNTQDLVVKAKESSEGVQLFRIDKILGRDNDILVTPSGNLLIVHLFTIYFEYFDSIRQFQIEQTKSDVFIFRFVVSQNFTSQTQKQIFDYWQNFLGRNVKLIFEIHESIPLLYSGKRRFLIRNSEIKLPY